MGNLARIDPATMVYDGNRGIAVQIVADDRHRRELMAALVADQGARLVACQTAAASVARIGVAGARLALADLRGTGGEVADRIMAALAGAPFDEAPFLEALVIVDSDAIDHAHARLGGTPIPVIVDPHDDELGAMLAELLGRPTGLLREDGPGSNSRRLAQLSEEVGRIARTLASLSVEGAATAETARAGDPAEMLAAVRGILRVRRLREQYFDRALFADPAWDMLLDLFAARLEGRRVAVSSLCIAAAVPPTTALRWIATMTAEGLLLREPDPEDGRRVFIALADRAAAAMAAYLAATAGAGPPAG